MTGRWAKKSWIFLAVLWLMTACNGDRLKVVSIGEPDYPLMARLDRIQGTVSVIVTIEPDGKVVSAGGTGANPVLVRAAEANAREWIFGPFPTRYKFPAYHVITYVFKLEGQPTETAPEPCDVRTDLPDKIEVSATPVEGDTVNSLPHYPAGKP